MGGSGGGTNIHKSVSGSPVPAPQKHLFSSAGLRRHGHRGREKGAAAGRRGGWGGRPILRKFLVPVASRKHCWEDNVTEEDGGPIISVTGREETLEHVLSLAVLGGGGSISIISAVLMFPPPSTRCVRLWSLYKLMTSASRLLPSGERPGECGGGGHR